MSDIFLDTVKSVEKTILTAYEQDLAAGKTVLQQTISEFSVLLKFFVLAEISAPGIEFWIASVPQVLSTLALTSPHHYIYTLTGITRIYFETALLGLEFSGYEVEANKNPSTGESFYRITINPDVRKATLASAATIASRILGQP